MRTYTLRLPCRVILRTRKRDNKEIFFRLNINEYRNRHHRDLAASKVLFTELVMPLLENLEGFKQIELEYKLFLANRRKIDTNNILAIVDKYFQDCLVKAEVIPNDTYEFVTRTVLEFGDLDLEADDHYAVVKIRGI